MQIPDTPPTRRELNKVATREALVRAAVDLVTEHGLEAVTADMVAEQAGVSRRTFFNYFAGIEDCLSSSLDNILRDAIIEFEAEPLDQPVMTSASDAFSNVFTAEATPLLARMFGLTRTHPRMLRSHLAQWDKATDEITEALGRRFPDADPLWVQTMAASMVGVAESAIRAWLDTLIEDSSQDPAERAAAKSHDLRATVERCFGYLADGFTSAPPAP